MLSSLFMFCLHHFLREHNPFLTCIYFSLWPLPRNRVLPDPLWCATPVATCTDIWPRPRQCETNPQSLPLILSSSVCCLCPRRAATTQATRWWWTRWSTTFTCCPAESSTPRPPPSSVRTANATTHTAHTRRCQGSVPENSTIPAANWSGPLLAPALWFPPLFLRSLPDEHYALRPSICSDFIS